MNLHLLESAFTLTWQSSVRACVLIIAVLVVQAVAGKRLPARFRYALGLLVLLRLLMPVAPASSWSVFNLARHARPAPTAAPSPPPVVLPPVRAGASSTRAPIAMSGPPRLSLPRWAAVAWCCGGAAFLLTVLWRRRRFSRSVAQLPSATDANLLELVRRCKNDVGVRRAVRIAVVPTANSAAVFGFLRPCLLIPEGLLDTLEAREARLVLLHEFFHIRRRDVLVNWISVLALALHWFNPLAWLAMRRLRADQELACDASVLASIDQSERRSYGQTLLKHLHDFPAARMAAGLVPLITSRHNIKRRIIMITEFKNTGGLARGLFALLCLALGGLTFTRAADDLTAAAPSTSLPPAADALPRFRDAPTVTPPSKGGQDYGAEYVKQSTLLRELTLMDHDDHSRFVQALSTTASDPILNSLLEQELAQEGRLAGFKRAGRFSEAPEVKDEIAVISDLKVRIDQRADGIMAGMMLQVAALKAAANDGLRRAPPPERTLSQSLQDWDHQRVLAMADYLEYSNIWFNLNLLPTDQLGGALQTAYAHQTDPELNDLAGGLRVARERMAEVEQKYGPDMPGYKTVKKQLEESEAAYQRKIDAVMLGIKTRVNEDKGLVQLYEQEVKTIEEIVRKQQEQHQY